MKGIFRNLIKGSSKQKQEIKENSNAVQAGNDVNITYNIHQVKADEVEEIVIEILEKNFPKLKEEASKTALENVEKWLKIFKVQLARNYEKIDFNEFKDPNNQFLLNEAVSSCARKGDKIDLDLLSTIILEKMKKGQIDLISIVCEEAIQVLKKLDSQQINFLSFVHFWKAMSLANDNEKNVNIETKRLVNFLGNGMNISIPNMKYLDYISVLTVSATGINNLYKLLKHNHNFFRDLSNEEIDKVIEKDFPAYNFLKVKYTEKRINRVNLTSVGELIALANLKRIYPEIDYKIWIK